MKKLLSVGLTFALVSCACISFVSCKPKELQLDKEYVYTDISFKKADGLTLEDIDEFVPILPTVAGAPITTVGEFEKYLCENIDAYSIERLTENGRERIYLKPSILSVRLTEGYPYIADAYSLWLKYENREEEMRYGVVREDDVFACPDSMTTIPDFYFKNGALHYDLEFNEKFSVVYNYELQ